MGFFSRNKEAIEAGRGDHLPFDAARRSPRNKRKTAADNKFDSGSPIDPAETTRTRARRRLIGAIALALAAIVFVPMLFDRTPASPSDDIVLQLPDRDAPFEGRRGVPDASKGPLVSSTDLPAAAAAAPIVAAPSVADEAASSADRSAPAADKPVVVDQVKTEAASVPTQKVDKPAAARASEAVTEKTSDKPSDKAKPVSANSANSANLSHSVDTTSTSAATDDPRAIAALEGKSEVTTTKPIDAMNGRGYAVQIGAYASSETARHLHDQLAANGLRSYVEPISTSNGPRTRLRLGPFPSRDAAERARTKLKTMKLDGSVVPL